MAYSTKDDILKQLTEAELIGLTDDAGSGWVDDAIVTRAIADADEEIDAYIGMRYPVPLSPVPALVRRWSVEAAIYNLYARRLGAPEAREKRYLSIQADLRRVADGKLSLGANDPDPPPSDSGTTEVSAATQVFSRDKLEGF